MSNFSVSAEIVECAKKIKIVLMDVDGVLTQGFIVYDSNGLEIKHFNAHDGLAIKLAKLSGLKTGIISARDSGTIRHRAKELGMDYLYLGQSKKLPAFLELKKSLNLESEKFCFIGDDLPDIPVMKEVGLAVAVKNASFLTQQNADYVTSSKGGDGAVREVIEIILDVQGILDSTIKKLWE